MKIQNIWHHRTILLFLALVLGLPACIPLDAPDDETGPYVSNTVSSVPDTTDVQATPLPEATGQPDARDERAVQQLLGEFDCAAASGEGEWAEVVEVIDGDTITVLRNGVGEKVRYIGINAPEMDEPAGQQALVCNRALVEGQPVYMLKDVSETDQYGRLLRYLFTADAFVNASLVSDGCALQAAYPPDTACSALLQEQEAAAKSAGLGLWERPAAEDDPAAGVQIREVFYDGVQGQNEPDEYVVIENTGVLPVELEGWYLKDQGSHRFIFPDTRLAPGQVCRIYTNENHPEHCGLSFGVSGSAVWNNGGDCAFLFTSEGLLVDELCY